VDPQFVAFVLLALVGLFAALMMVTRTNLVHAALYLVVTFLVVAAMYVVLHAEFLAAVQVLVYAGGIMVLFLFVILLVDLPREMAAPRKPRNVHVATALILSAVVVGLLGYEVVVTRAAPSAGGASLFAEGGNLETVALALFRYYLLPFEVVSLLLLVAMVGAILLARAKA